MDMTSVSEEEATCLIEFKKLIKDSEDENFHHLVQELFSDEWFLLFIRCKKYVVQAAFEAAKTMTSIPKKYPDSMLKFHPETLRSVVSTQGKGTLKQRDAMGCQVLVVRLKCWDPKAHSIDELLLGLMLIGLEMIRSKETQICGINIIANIEGITFTQARQISPFVVKRFVDIIVSSTPLKFKGLHVTHVHPLANVPLSLLKCFLPEKLKKRVHTHSCNETLHKFFDPSTLPDWLGGTLKESEALDMSIMGNLYSAPVTEWYDKIVKIAKKETKK